MPSVVVGWDCVAILLLKKIQMFFFLVYQFSTCGIVITKKRGDVNMLEA